MYHSRKYLIKECIPRRKYFEYNFVKNIKELANFIYSNALKLILKKKSVKVKRFCYLLTLILESASS